MEECYGVECKLRAGNKCLHPDVHDTKNHGQEVLRQMDEPRWMIFCPKVKHSNLELYNIRR